MNETRCFLQKIQPLIIPLSMIILYTHQRNSIPSVTSFKMTLHKRNGMWFDSKVLSCLKSMNYPDYETLFKDF